MKFTQFYANSPVCSTTRAALMTGRYNFGNYTSFGELQLSEKTFGNVLKDAGYKTAIVGKWQLSERDFQSPFQFGFDEYLLWHFGMRVNSVPTPGSQGSRYWDQVFYHNGKQLPDMKGKFGSDVMADYVESYIKQHQAEPSFLYCPLVLPNDSWVEPPGYEKRGGFPAEFCALEGRSDAANPEIEAERQRLLPQWSNT